METECHEAGRISDAISLGARAHFAGNIWSPLAELWNSESAPVASGDRRSGTPLFARIVHLPATSTKTRSSSTLALRTDQKKLDSVLAATESEARSDAADSAERAAEDAGSGRAVDLGCTGR